MIALAFIASCDNDLDIIAEWKDISVVYGILNAQDSVHYVKLNKAFLGQGDVYDMAQEFDSLALQPRRSWIAFRLSIVCWRSIY